MKKDINWPAKEFTLQDLIGLNPQFDPLTLHFLVNRKLADGSVAQKQSGLLVDCRPRNHAPEVTPRGSVSTMPRRTATPPTRSGKTTRRRNVATPSRRQKSRAV